MGRGAFDTLGVTRAHYTLNPEELKQT